MIYTENERDFLDQLREGAGMVPSRGEAQLRTSLHGPLAYETLTVSEWSPEFERLMRNRLVMGAIRYGRLNAPGKNKYDRVVSIQKRIAKYGETGNAEHLVDVANEALLEFAEPSHPNAHFEAADDPELHTPEMKRMSFSEAYGRPVQAGKSTMVQELAAQAKAEGRTVQDFTRYTKEASVPRTDERPIIVWCEKCRHYHAPSEGDVLYSPCPNCGAAVPVPTVPVRGREGS